MDNGSEFTSPRLWIVLAKCHRALRQVVECSIGGTGMVLSDFMVLETLLHKGPQSISEIQSRVLLATGSMTAAVDRVERKGLVVRTTTPNDRRAKVLALTESGRNLIEAAYVQHAADLADVMFSGGLVRHGNGTATLYAGLSDTEAGQLLLADPFEKYKNHKPQNNYQTIPTKHG